ncbi:hypothetical protein [Streptomyces fagopyri]
MPGLALTGALVLRHYLPALPRPPLSTDGRLVDALATFCCEDAPA